MTETCLRLFWASPLTPHSISPSLQAQTFLGLCHVSMGDIQQGASHYEQVLRLDPDNLEACVYLAQACKEVGYQAPPPVKARYCHIDVSALPWPLPADKPQVIPEVMDPLNC